MPLRRYSRTIALAISLLGAASTIGVLAGCSKSDTDTTTGKSGTEYYSGQLKGKGGKVDPNRQVKPMGGAAGGIQ